MASYIGRRKFLATLGGAAAAWPIAAQAQQAEMPVIGFLRSTPSSPFEHFTAAFRQGLKDAGFIEGQNVSIEYRYADNQPDRLPTLVTDLVRRGVAVIACNGDAAAAAKAATGTIPIVFATGEDPVRQGLVTNLARPDGNLTGVTFFSGGVLSEKRMELLHDLIPKATLVAALADPNYGGAEADLQGAHTAGRALGKQIMVVNAAGQADFEVAFAKFAQAGAGALLVAGGSVFTSQRQAIVTLAARHALPTIYPNREYVVAGGLISYSASVAGAYRQVGVYTGRILSGAKPSDLPVRLPVKLELVINLKTAKALGLDVPPSLHVRADEVIE
jgi:putative ABC transport system substrate-binding protein